jgi:hypothetical protein
MTIKTLELVFAIPYTNNHRTLPSNYSTREPCDLHIKGGATMAGITYATDFTPKNLW